MNLIEPISESLFERSLSIDGAKSGTWRATRQGLFLHVEADFGPANMRHGLAAFSNGRLLMAYGPKGKVEIGVYRFTGDRAEAVWVPPGAAGDSLAGSGSEISRREGDRFVIEKAHAVDQQSYTGSLVIDPHPRELTSVVAATIRWTLHDGEYSSFGLLGRDFMVSTFNFEKGTPCGVAVYERSSDVWEGRVLDGGTSEVKRERLVGASR